MVNKKISIGIVFLMAILFAIFLFFSQSQKVSINFSTKPETSSQAEKTEKENSVEEKTETLEAEKNISQTNVSAEKVSSEKNNSAKIKIIEHWVKFGFTSSAERKIDTLVVHSSYNALGGDEYAVEKLINEYKEYGVAPHYLIDRRGNIYQLVKEKDIAYHAGESKVPDGRTNVNNFSLGVEIMENKIDGPTSAQYSALKKLIAEIKTRHTLKYILGHDQIAPGRKDDPWNFDWNKI
jgi:N-acetyl-anhydromuramyl-L-alanine amidase AmpD